MKNAEIIMMVSRGFDNISEQLSNIAECLGRIEALVSSGGIAGNGSEKLPGKYTGNISPDEKLNKAQAAKALGISVRTLDRYRLKGIVPFCQLNGGKVTFRYKDIIAVRDKVKGYNHGRDYFSELVSGSNS